MSALVNKMICGLFSGPETKRHSAICIHIFTLFPPCGLLGSMPSMCWSLGEFQSMVWETSTVRQGKVAMIKQYGQLWGNSQPFPWLCFICYYWHSYFSHPLTCWYASLLAFRSLPSHCVTGCLRNYWTKCSGHPSLLCFSFTDQPHYCCVWVHSNSALSDMVTHLSPEPWTCFILSLALSLGRKLYIHAAQWFVLGGWWCVLAPEKAKLKKSIF